MNSIRSILVITARNLPFSRTTAMRRAPLANASDTSERGVDGLTSRHPATAIVLTGATMAPLIGRLVGAIGEGTFELPLDPTEFTLAQYDDAMAFLDSKQRRGKLVVTVD